MTTSEQVNEIAGALAKAQAAMKNAPFNKSNPHFKSKFADLTSVRDTVTPALTANGIAVVQALSGSAVTTRLVHSSGQWFESECPIPTVQDMQKLGSAITYARRYSLSAICGIAADEDDDGNAAATVKADTVPDGYEVWLGDLQIVAAEKGFDFLVKTIKVSREDYRTRLAADKKTWEALKTKAANAMVAA